jgi:hypothetical protein
MDPTWQLPWGGMHHVTAIERIAAYPQRHRRGSCDDYDLDRSIRCRLSLRMVKSGILFEMVAAAALAVEILVVAFGFTY